MLLAFALAATQAPSDAPPAEEQRVVPMASSGAWLDLGRTMTGSAVKLDLIAAEIQLVAAPSGRIEIKVDPIAGGADLSRMRLRISEAGGTVSLMDLFPQRSASWVMDECLPPSDARGDFWSVPGRYRLTIRLPRGVLLESRLRDGGVEDRRRYGDR